MAFQLYHERGKAGPAYDRLLVSCVSAGLSSSSSTSPALQVEEPSLLVKLLRWKVRNFTTDLSFRELLDVIGSPTSSYMWRKEAGLDSARTIRVGVDTVSPVLVASSFSCDPSPNTHPPTLP
jgi:hypothetical protein